jgi:hypothetical protein
LTAIETSFISFVPVTSETVEKMPKAGQHLGGCPDLREIGVRPRRIRADLRRHLTIEIVHFFGCRVDVTLDQVDEPRCRGRMKILLFGGRK